jgi:hypothetical protein
MGKMLRQSILAGVLSAVPVMAFPATSTAAPPRSRDAVEATEARHATTGTVRSLNATSLVIARSAKKGGETRFVLTPSTQREGVITVGSLVSIRYRDEGGAHIATAVAARHQQQPQAGHGPSKR